MSGLPNAQGYGISSREVSTIEPTHAILLVNVSGGFDIQLSDIIDNSKQARVCQRLLPVPTNILVTSARNNGHPGVQRAEETGHAQHVRKFNSEGP